MLEKPARKSWGSSRRPEAGVLPVIERKHCHALDLKQQTCAAGVLGFCELAATFIRRKGSARLTASLRRQAYPMRGVWPSRETRVGGGDGDWEFAVTSHCRTFKTNSNTNSNKVALDRNVMYGVPACGEVQLSWRWGIGMPGDTT